ncbi:Ethylene-insensitive protein 2 [Linum perenne]
MDTDTGNANHIPVVLRRLLPTVGPVLLISVAYVDPGKWAATVDGGARFGIDLVLPMLMFNLAAILCQYLSAKVGIITGRDLARICSEEYDKGTCMLLGIQTAVSVMALDLSMVLGIAHGLNLLLGLDLPTCIFLTAVDAVLFPFFGAFVEKHKGYYPSICVAGSVLLFYFLGVLISQPEVPLSLNGMLMKLSEESAFALMSLLGASIMPHNFYMHSSIVLHHQRSPNVSKSSLCYDNFIAILCIFSGIYLVNYVLMNSAANVFHSTGLVLVTFPDALSLMEQVFRSPVAPLFFVGILYLSNQISALTWNHGGQVVVHDFLLLDIPNWLQRATTRIVAIVPALYCVWTSGVEGAYQLLIFSQVMVALLLPSSVIPLFRVASSRAIMGAHKISQVLEFLAVVAFMGMLGLKIIFVVEMIFGDSDWVGNLQWNMGSSSSVPYAVLILTAFTSFCLMLWLAATPLKSATQTEAQVWNWDAKQTVPEPSMRRDESYLGETRYEGEGHVHKQEAVPIPVKPFESYTDRALTNADPHLPETILDSHKDIHIRPIVENQSDMKFSSPLRPNQSESAPSVELISVSKAANVVVTDLDLPDSKMKVESPEPIDKTVSMEGDLLAGKEDDKGDTWEPEEPSKGVPESVSSLASDGPASFRSLSGKSDDGGNGAGSLSRLAGLGRAARRQLATVLDEFWGQLYDFHGQATQDAKNRRIDLLLIDSKLSFSFLKVDPPAIEPFMSPSFCDSPRQMTMQNSLDSPYGGRRGTSSLLSNHSQLLDNTYSVARSTVVDPSERRYSSVRNLPSSDGWGNSNTQPATNRRYSSVRTLPSSDGWGNTQPATIHGYQIASIANRIAKERSSSGLNGGMESMSPISSAMGMRSYRDPQASALGQRLQSGLSSPQATGYQNFAVSRNSSLQSETQYFDASNNTGQGTSTKKYHSLPDISGIAGPYRELYLSRNPTQRDGSGGFASSLGRTSYESSLHPNARSGSANSLGFDDISTSYGDAYSFPTTTGTTTSTSTPGTGSLWSMQPFEQFGVGDRSAVGSSRSNSIAREASSIVDAEAKLLRSFRCCIVKLLKLEGSEWLFRQNDGADEDLIDRVAARERCLYEAEAREMGGQGVHLGESQSSSEKKHTSVQKNDDAGIASIMVSSIPHCGEGCVWKADLIVSFGVWCIHRVLDLSLMESRPELWGKYTYVLNRLQVSLL